MVKYVVSAVQTDKTKALDEFTHGTGGFRTADTYVFCVGPDSVMSAHPNPILQGHDVHELHDKTGNYFIKTMISEAKAEQVSVIRYLFPKPGSTIEEPKTTYYTKAGDQVCGVGVYDADANVSPEEATPRARIAHLRQKLDGAIPASARGDWTAFLEALDQERGLQGEVITKVRKNLEAAEAALGPAAKASSAGGDE